MIEVSFGGFEGIEAALMELKTSTAKGVARRVLKKNSQPIADATNAAAPRDPNGDENHLAGSYVVTSRLNKRQSSAARKEGRDDVFMYIGTNNVAGSKQEFGTVNHPAQPHFRPQWEGGKAGLLNGVTRDMAVEVQKSVMRARRKAARAQ